MSTTGSRRRRGFPRALLALAGLGLVVVAVWRAARPAPPLPGATPPALASAPPTPPAFASTNAETEAANASPPPPPAAPLPNGDAAEEAIHELAITYDAASIPALARYLDHPDPEIRAAAREGFIALGERAAIPVLRAAAERASAEEATLLREAADFLALPTWSERRAALKAGASSSAP